MNNVSQKTNIFQLIKDIPFPEVVRIFHQEPNRANKVPCPFHSENNPSCHVYLDGFKCFGCGAVGDGVDFVSKLENVNPLEAAKAIAQKFGLQFDRVDPPATRSRKRLASLSKALQQWRQKAFLQAVKLRDLSKKALQHYRLEVPDRLLPAVHRVELFEHWADILATGTDAEVLELFKDPEVRRWLKSKS